MTQEIAILVNYGEGWEVLNYCDTMEEAQTKLEQNKLKKPQFRFKIFVGNLKR